MSFITFQCYKCGKSLKVGGDKAGKKAKCIGCETVLTIPMQSGEVPTAKSSSAPSPGPKSSSSPSMSSSQSARMSTVAEEKVVAPIFAEYIPDELEEVPTPSSRSSRQDRIEEDGDEFYDEDQGRDRRPKGSAGGSAWKRAQLGLLLLFIGGCVMAGAFGLQFLGYLFQSIPTTYVMTASPKSPDDFRRMGETMRSMEWMSKTAPTMLGISALIAIGAIGTSIAGYVFTMLGPSRGGSFGMSIAAIAVAGVQIIMMLIFEIPLMFSRDGLGVFGFSRESIFGTWFALFFIQLLYGAEIVLLPLIVRGFSMAAKKRELAGSAMTVLIIGAIYTGLRAITFILWYIGMNMRSGSAESGRTFGWILLILLWIGLFVYIGYIIFYLMFLSKSRRALPSK